VHLIRQESPVRRAGGAGRRTTVIYDCESRIGARVRRRRRRRRRYRYYYYLRGGLLLYGCVFYLLALAVV
jgi:hypothetical protein